MRRSVTTLSAAIAISFAVAVPVQAEPAPMVPHPPDVITLITGDQVFLTTRPTGETDIEVKAADGREAVEFVRLDDGADVLVLPADAAPQVASGKLDKRLFNVTELVREGFTDGPLPLIVAHDGPVAATAGGLALTSINATAVKANEAIWSASGVTRVWLDATARLVDDESNAQIGAPAAWQAGFTGQGVTIADLDSGYDPAHADLRGVVVGTKDFLGGTMDDGLGHGTHTAGIIAGSGAASQGKYKGVAPDAKLLIGKVCDAQGSCPNSAIIAGMEWAAASGAKAVNLSLGGSPTDGTDPMSLALNNLTAQTGTLFVVAAGNSGRPNTVASPGSADAALTVGSVTKQDALSSFSSRGPRTGDLAIKPDIAAPGSAIIAARAAGTSMGTPVDANYTSASGTSMATPHVTGAVAILAQQHPDWRAAQLKEALMSASKPLPALSVYEQGAGRLDVAAATTRLVTASPASLSFGLLKWPHPADVTKEVSYRNDGAEPITFELAVSAPYTLNTTKVTVPAHGTTSATVTLRPGAEGDHQGRLVATAGQTVLSTAIGATVEGERYGLTVTTTGRTGTAPQLTTGTIVDAATGRGVGLLFGQSPFTFRLPKGRYDVHAMLADPYTGNVAGARSLVARTDLLLDADTAVPLDARTATRITGAVRGIQTTAESNEFGVNVGLSGVTYVADPTAPLYATPTKKITDRKYTFHFSPALNAGTDVWRPIHWNTTGIPEKLDFVASSRDFATVHADYGAQAPGSTGLRGIHGFHPGASGGITPLRPIPLPAKRVEHYWASKEVTWSNSLYFIEIQPVYRYETETAVRKSFDRKTYEMRWNQSPIGPATGPLDLGWGVQRKGAQLTAYVPLFSGAGDDTFTQSFNAKLAASTTLTKDGKVVGSTIYPGYGAFTAPGAGVYTLRTSATRALPWSVLGTSAEATWTLHDPGTDGVLPLLVVRTSAKGEARAGKPHCLDVEVERPTGSRIKRLALEVSFDDGKTWRRAPVIGGHALVVHPTTAGFVSLRSTAEDRSGNSVTQTVIRAYQTR